MIPVSKGHSEFYSTTQDPRARKSRINGLHNKALHRDNYEAVGRGCPSAVRQPAYSGTHSSRCNSPASKMISTMKTADVVPGNDWPVAAIMRHAIPKDID